MVDKRDCSFCGKPIEPGTGKLYIKKDGTKFWFDSSKCQANLVELKRVSRKVKWTTHYVKGIAGASGAAATSAEEGASKKAKKQAAAETAAPAPSES